MTARLPRGTRRRHLLYPPIGSSPIRVLCILGVLLTLPSSSSSTCPVSSSSSSSGSASSSCSSSTSGRKKSRRNEHSVVSHVNLHRCCSSASSDRRRHIQLDLPSTCSLQRRGRKHRHAFHQSSSRLHWNRQMINSDRCCSTHSYSSSTSDMAAIKRNTP